MNTNIQSKSSKFSVEFRDKNETINKTLSKKCNNLNTAKTKNNKSILYEKLPESRTKKVFKLKMEGVISNFVF